MEELRTLAIHLVTWNHRAYLPELFGSLDEQTWKQTSVTVVDNASNDGTADWMRDFRPGVVVLRNFRNQGFARAHNQAIAMSLSRWPEETWSSRYIMVASPNLVLASDCLEQLVKRMDQNPSLAACCPKILRAVFRAGTEDDAPEIERTQETASVGLIMKKSRHPIDRGVGEQDTGQYDEEREVFGCSGTCMLIRASALAEAKIDGEWFDEDFFSYGVDADFFWRLQRMGKQIRVVPSAVAWHHHALHQRTGATRTPAAQAMAARNRFWTTIKNDQVSNWLLHLPWIIAGGLWSALRSPSRIRGKFSSLIKVPLMLRKRAEVQPRVQVHASEIRHWFV